MRNDVARVLAIVPLRAAWLALYILGDRSHHWWGLRGGGWSKTGGGMSGHAERASVAPREREVERSPRDQGFDWPVTITFVAGVIAAYAVFAGAIYVTITALFL